MENVDDTIKAVKDKLPNLTPTPPDLHAHATVHELKSRLNLGEPALTIFDVRNQAAFRDCRIMGAMSLTLDSLQRGERPSLETKRDIYVYGDTDDESVTAANLIRSYGFTRVAELRGGLKAWQSVGGAVEGMATETPTKNPDAFNVFARLKKFSAEKNAEGKLKT